MIAQRPASGEPSVVSDVAQRGGMARGDDADRARERGQRALALGREPARRLEPRLEPRELLVQRAEAGEARRSRH